MIVVFRSGKGGHAPVRRVYLEWGAKCPGDKVGVLYTSEQGKVAALVAEAVAALNDEAPGVTVIEGHPMLVSSGHGGGAEKVLAFDSPWAKKNAEALAEKAWACWDSLKVGDHLEHDGDTYVLKSSELADFLVVPVHSLAFTTGEVKAAKVAKTAIVKEVEAKLSKFMADTLWGAPGPTLANGLMEATDLPPETGDPEYMVVLPVGMSKDKASAMADEVHELKSKGLFINPSEPVSLEFEGQEYRAILYTSLGGTKVVVNGPFPPGAEVNINKVLLGAEGLFSAVKPASGGVIKGGPLPLLGASSGEQFLPKGSSFIGLDMAAKGGGISLGKYSVHVVDGVGGDTVVALTNGYMTVNLSLAEITAAKYPKAFVMEQVTSVFGEEAIYAVEDMLVAYLGMKAHDAPAPGYNKSKGTPGAQPGGGVVGVPVLKGALLVPGQPGPGKIQSFEVGGHALNSTLDWDPEAPVSSMPTVHTMLSTMGETNFAVVDKKGTNPVLDFVGGDWSGVVRGRVEYLGGGVVRVSAAGYHVHVKAKDGVAVVQGQDDDLLVEVTYPGHPTVVILPRKVSHPDAMLYYAVSPWAQASFRVDMDKALSSHSYLYRTHMRAVFPGVRLAGKVDLEVAYEIHKMLTEHGVGAMVPLAHGAEMTVVLVGGYGQVPFKKGEETVPDYEGVAYTLFEAKDGSHKVSVDSSALAWVEGAGMRFLTCRLASVADPAELCNVALAAT